MNYDEIKLFFAQRIRYLNWEFYVGQKDEAVYLQVRFSAPNNYHPTEIERQHCRKYLLSSWMTPTELVQTGWLAIQRAVLHEASEQFYYKGLDIFNTHINVERLADLRELDDALEHRK